MQLWARLWVQGLRESEQNHYRTIKTYKLSGRDDQTTHVWLR
jgi:hypothetical protein